jgi:hypothetical protein
MNSKIEGRCYLSGLYRAGAIEQKYGVLCRRFAKRKETCPASAASSRSQVMQIMSLHFQCRRRVGEQSLHKERLGFCSKKSSKEEHKTGRVRYGRYVLFIVLIVEVTPRVAIDLAFRKWKNLRIC